MENFITGPFENLDETKLVKKLDDGQIITFNTKQKNVCTAIIRKKNIAIDLEKRDDTRFDNQLSGNISSMLLEKKSKNILATVTIHDLPIAIDLHLIK